MLQRKNPLQVGNHRTQRYTVIGRFESFQSAKHATNELTQLLAQIANWYEQPENVAVYEAWKHGEMKELSEPEMEFTRAHQLDWGHRPVDWLWEDGSDFTPVRVRGHILFLIPTQDTHMGARPFVDLIVKFGGAGTADGYLFDHGQPNQVLAIVLTDLTCNAPDVAIAESIYATMQTYFEAAIRQPSTAPDAPWKSFCSEEDYAPGNGTLRRNGRQLKFEALEFTQLGLGLTGLVEYLVDKKCFPMQFNFTTSFFPDMAAD